MDRTRLIDQPEPGFFTLRMVRGGPLVAARIYRPCPLEMAVWEPWQHLDRWYALEAEIDGQPCAVDRVWLFGRPIPWREFEFLSHRAQWARDHAPDHPAARPRERIDLGRMKPLF